VVVSKETFAKKGLLFFTEGKYLVYIMVNFCGCHYHFNNREKKASIVQKCGKYLALTIIIFKRLYLLVHLIFLLSQWHRRHIFLFFLDGVFHDQKPRPSVLKAVLTDAGAARPGGHSSSHGGSSSSGEAGISGRAQHYTAGSRRPVAVGDRGALVAEPHQAAVIRPDFLFSF